MTHAHSTEEVEEEVKHFSNVVTTFSQYEQYSVGPHCWFLFSIVKTTPFQLAANNRRRKDLYTLPRADQEILENLGYKQKLADVDVAIQANAHFLGQIIENPEIFGHDLNSQEPEGDVDSTDHDENEPNGSVPPSNGEYRLSTAFSSDSRFTNPLPVFVRTLTFVAFV
jgi:carnosine N-methyltransferase